MRSDRESRPVVSVIIPAFRASRDIPDALASVFAQTFSSFEAIVVDDGSPDRDELVAAIAPYRSRVRYIEQSNQGAGAARNAAIRIARGRYLGLIGGVFASVCAAAVDIIVTSGASSCSPRWPP